jgi:hypothetical protein|tara:strand:+ start:511 stop:1305 length:795 start_codon:yes stop_codon:yes gene_type:complete
MKSLIFQVYVGPKSRLYDHCTASAKAYAERIDADYVLLTQPKLRIKPDPFSSNRSEGAARLGYLPIFEKENAFEYFDKGYDQIAIIDSDIWIRDTLTTSIFDKVPPEYDFGGVLERDMPCTPQYERKIANYSRMQYGMPGMNQLFDWNDPRGRGADFYNMGMMVVNKGIVKYLKGQTPKQFIERSEFRNFVDGIGTWKWSTDQTLLNYWVKKEKMKVKNLTYHWNGLFTGIEQQRVKECNFIHFFLKDKLPQRGENVEELMKHV